MRKAIIGNRNCLKFHVSILAEGLSQLSDLLKRPVSLEAFGVSLKSRTGNVLVLNSAILGYAAYTRRVMRKYYLPVRTVP